jgi:hypothetical protein
MLRASAVSLFCLQRDCLSMVEGNSSKVIVTFTVPASIQPGGNFQCVPSGYRKWSSPALEQAVLVRRRRSSQSRPCKPGNSHTFQSTGRPRATIRAEMHDVHQPVFCRRWPTLAIAYSIATNLSFVEVIELSDKALKAQQRVVGVRPLLRLLRW